MSDNKIVTGALLMGEIEQHNLMVQYLKREGYKSVEEWADDSDYLYNDENGEWFDEYNTPVDIEGMLLAAIESMNSNKMKGGEK